MHPTIEFGSFELPVYTALIALGAALGLLTAYLFLRTRSRRAAALPFFLDSALFTFAAGWVGARAYHVATHWNYYQARPEEIAQVGLGGWGIRGALLAGLSVLALYARVRKVSFWNLADAAALGLAIGQALGWAGALVHGANYGVVSDSRIAMDLADRYGLVQPRFPLQHAEIVLFALVFLGLIALALQQPRPGMLFVAYLLVASLANALLGFQRGDETAYVGALRVDQVVDVALSLLALSVMLWRMKRRSHDLHWGIGEGNVG